MTKYDFNGMCDSLIQAGYFLVKATNQDGQGQLRLSQEQKEILLEHAKFIVRHLEEAEIKDNQIVKVKTKKID